MESLPETGRLGKLGYRGIPEDTQIGKTLRVNIYCSFILPPLHLTATYSKTHSSYSMNSFNDIHAMLEWVPGLADLIGMEKGMAFVRLATWLKDEILSKQKATHDPSQPPETLPENINKFLSNVVNIPSEYVQGCWAAFADTIWQRDVNGDSRGEDAKLFKRYGLQGLLCELSFIAVSGVY